MAIVRHPAGIILFPETTDDRVLLETISACSAYRVEYWMERDAYGMLIQLSVDEHWWQK